MTVCKFDIDLISRSFWLKIADHEFHLKKPRQQYRCHMQYMTRSVLNSILDLVLRRYIFLTYIYSYAESPSGADGPARAVALLDNMYDAYQFKWNQI
jgi:hypothetical protein